MAQLIPPLPRFVIRQSTRAQRPPERLGPGRLDSLLDERGEAGSVSRRLDADVDRSMGRILSLSPLSAPLALDYLGRLSRPIPMLTPGLGAQVVGRGYVAHMLAESNPQRYGASSVPVLGTLPPPRRGRPPQDLLSRVVKVSRRGFEEVCALSPPAWAGFVDCLTKRAHDQAAGVESLVPRDAVDGLARFAWVLRQVDLHYGLEPERPS